MRATTFYSAAPLLPSAHLPARVPVICMWTLPSFGHVLVVMCVVGVVVDQVEERSTMALMGNQWKYNFSYSMIRRNEQCIIDNVPVAERPVVSTIEAQLCAAQSRMAGGRAPVRASLGKAMSALPVVPELVTSHGLSAGQADLYRVILFFLTPCTSGSSTCFGISLSAFRLCCSTCAAHLMLCTAVFNAPSTLSTSGRIRWARSPKHLLLLHGMLCWACGVESERA